MGTDARIRTKVSAGIVIRHGNRILLCHSMDKPPRGYHTPPKGGLDPGESPLDAAIRETWEEVGIRVDEKSLEAGSIVIRYTNEKSGLVKITHLFTLIISDLSEVGLTCDMVPPDRLQPGEIDWAGFLDSQQASGLVHPRFLCLFQDDI